MSSMAPQAAASPTCTVGNYDLSFQVAEAYAYQLSVKDARVIISDTAHFALDTDSFNTISRARLYLPL